jgi:hypothetical protein
MIESRHRHRPKNWRDFQQSIRHRWLMPFLCIDWIAAWAAYFLSKTSFLEFLEYCGSFSILVGVIFYFLDGPQRTKIMHYQAWQVINSAQGKGGSGGRAEALHELNEDHVRLVGVDLTDAFLQDMQLEHADLRRSRLVGADLKGANLGRCNFDDSRLNAANFVGAQLSAVNFTDVYLDEADLTNATLAGANLQNASLKHVDLRGADLSNIVGWKTILNIERTNIHNIKNPPDGFVPWALSKGAVDQATGWQ